MLTFLAIGLPDTPETTGLQPAWRRAQDVLRELVHRHGGQETCSTGDSFVVAFSGTHATLQYLFDSRQALMLDGLSDHARFILHTSEVNEDENLASLLYSMLSAAHEGQVLCSEITAVLLRPHMKTGIQLQDMGVYRLPDGSTLERLFQLYLPGST